MPEKTVAQKAHVKPGTTIAVINRVAGVVESLGLPEDVAFVSPAAAQLVLVFTSARADLERQLPRAAARVGPASAMWVLFRKGSRDAGLDMNRDTVWAVAESCGLRPVGLVSVDETWTAFRFRWASAERRQGRAPSPARARAPRAAETGRRRAR